MAELSRHVSRAAADKDDAERERQSLLDALRSSEQVGPFNKSVHAFTESVIHSDCLSCTRTGLPIVILSAEQHDST